MCAGNLLLFTFYFLLVLRAAKVHIFRSDVLNFPFSVLYEFRGFRAVVRHHLHEVDAGVEGGGVDVPSLGRIIIRPYHHRMAGHVVHDDIAGPKPKRMFPIGLQNQFPTSPIQNRTCHLDGKSTYSLPEDTGQQQYKVVP